MGGGNVVRLPNIPSLTWDDCRLLVESVVDYAIFMLDVDGRVATWNRGAESIKGYTPSEIIGEPLTKFYTPEDVAADRPHRLLDKARELGHVEDEGWRVRKDGSRFWASVVITALRDESGRLRGYGKVTRDLTLRRAMEEQLRQSEARYHHLVDAVIDYAIFLLDTDGRVATWNAGAARAKGYDAKEIVGKHFSVFYTPEDRAAGKPQRMLETAIREGRVEDESWRVRKDGSLFWADVVITALRNEDGELTGFAKVTRDLTARRDAEEAQRRLVAERAARQVAEAAELQLRESQERYRGLSKRLEVILEGVADGITVEDRAGRIVYANGRAAEMSGFESPAELVAADPTDVSARFEISFADGRPATRDDLPARRLLSGETGGDVVVHVRERGTQRESWVHLRSRAVLDERGRPELAVNIWHDITAQRKDELAESYLGEAAAALGASLDRSQMLGVVASVLVPGLADWCSVYLLEGDRLVLVTTEHADPEKVALVAEYQERFSPDEEHAGAMWQAIRTGLPQVFNEIDDDALAMSTRDPEALDVLRGLGIRAALVVPIRQRGRMTGAISLVSSKHGRRYDARDIALVDELGRRTGIALENARLYAEAQVAVRLAEEASRAKDEFLATVSHELRTPLNAIVGWATLLRQRTHDPQIARPLEVIDRNARAQARIIDDILDVSRVVTGKLRIDPKPIDLVRVVSDAIDVVRPSTDAKRVDLVVDFATPSLPLVGDADRLQQVVWNLLANAVRFTERSGSITVRVEKESSTAIVTVTDSGRGIDPAFLPYVFERFRQADASTTRRVGGLGLGLALVRHIVELHGGHATASSGGAGAGAIFTVTLPIRAVARRGTAEAPAQPHVEEPPPRAALDRVRVLVVDDEADARELIATVLRECGASVECAASVAEAFQTFASWRPDVIVSDIGMPDEDGFSLIRRIRALPESEGGRTPALALTAFAHIEDRARALDAGYTAHVPKPVDPNVLAMAVVGIRSSS
jgi:PAS domain S-box-containing protein